MYVLVSGHFWSFEADVCASSDIFSTSNFLICVLESRHCHHSDQGLCQSPDILAGGSDGLKLKSRWDDLVVYVVPCYCQVVHGLQQQVCEIFSVNVSLLVGSAHVDNYHAQNVLK
jgi:hypothetical protein